MRDTHYRIVRALLPTTVCQLVFNYVLLRRDTNTLAGPDSRVPAGRLYGDMLLETLLQQQLGRVEQIVGEPLWPSYSYVRLHTHGIHMPEHTDRDGSEIGVTIAMGGDRPWPLWFRLGDGPMSVDLAPGDAVVYDGRMLPHWREPFEGDVQVQAMLFYVRQMGECAAWKYDRRAGVGTGQAPIDHAVA